MEQELEVVQKKDKKADEGNAKFDENNKLMLPVLENGKIEMQTQQEVQKLLDKKDKKQVAKSKPKSKAKKGRAVDGASIRSAFAKRVVKNIKGVTIVETDDKLLLKHGKSTICRLMCRQAGFCCYRKIDGERATLKVPNTKIETELMTWIGSEVERIKAKVKPPKVKKAKKSKVPKKGGGAKKASVEQKLEAAEAKARTHADANGFSLKSNKIKVTKEVEDWIEAKGYKLQTGSVKF